MALPVKSMAWFLAAALAVISGVVHVYENQVYLHFLYKLPDPGYAAVAAMQTENAFYYSYFHEMVEADSVLEGLKGMIWDRRTEYPDVLNAIRRFNIYQEIIVGLEFRVLRSFGFPLPHPYNFFRTHILVLNGVGQAMTSLLAAEISGNPLAGVACFLASFLNRFQISRLGNYTSSDLRELWGIPLLWLQVYLLWRLMLASRSSRAGGSYKLWFSYVVTTFAFIVSWQFSPFILLLQATAIYFVCIVAGYSSIRPLVVSVINAYLLALMLAVAVHFASPYLLTSPFFFQLVALKLSTTLFCCRRRGWLLGRLSDVAEGLVAVAGFLLVRKALEPFATADTHVYEILCTKVSEVNDILPVWMQLKQEQLPACAEPSFNANLYLIMGVFKLLSWDSLEVYIKTGAAQAASASCALVLLRCAVNSLMHHMCSKKQKVKTQAADSASSSTAATSASTSASGLRQRKGKEPVSGRSSQSSVSSRSKQPEELKGEDEEAFEAEDAALLFFVMQFLLFFLLGCLVNRLRVAFGPPMMILAATTCGPKLFPRVLQKRCPKLLHGVLLLLFLAQLAWMGKSLPCIKDNEGACQHTRDKISNDGDLLDLYDWINNEVKPGTPVLASMNLAGSMRAFTHVPMIIHPQFESENLRSRVQRAYELYNCGSEASFAETMKEFKAKVVIFEYSRCFFTPYTLDDKRKNCNSKKHQIEDLMCMKLHARSRRFKLLFMNGNYAAFQLRKKPLPLAEGQREPKAENIRAWLEDPSTWKDYVHQCEKTQGEKCGPRLMEAASHWNHGLKKATVAAVLRKWAIDVFPGNGFVNFYTARHLDHEANQPRKAIPYYETAVKKLPNNPKVLTEAILFYDLVLKDPSWSMALVERRSKIKDESSEEKNLLDLRGPGSGVLMCEAAVAAQSGGNTKLGTKLWKRARKLAPLSDCVMNNWPIINGEDDKSNSYGSHHTQWARLKMAMAEQVNIELGMHHQQGVRFLGSESFTIFPPRNKTIW